MNDRGMCGYRRANGEIGIRNVLLVLPVGQCGNELAVRCASGIDGAFPLLTTQPCAHLGDDNAAAKDCLIGWGRNPNAAAVLVLGIGCDALSVDEIADAIAETGTPVECLTVERTGRWEDVVGAGRCWLIDQARTVCGMTREPADVASLTLGIKCGGSDATSALAGNPAIGRTVDRWIDAGGTVVFSETTELIGAEHLLMTRASTEEARNGLRTAVDATIARIETTGVDPRGTQPTPGNIRGGLTTLEEKSLGGILKTGTRPIHSVFPWGGRPTGPGLHLMDCPANVPQLLLGWAAAGAHCLLFSVGGGLPARIPSLIGTNVGGLPLLPIIKILSNPRETDARAYFDIYAGGVLEGTDSMDAVSDRIWATTLETISGQPTWLEQYEPPGIQTWELLVRGPTV